MRQFQVEFRTLRYVVRRAQTFLLIAHAHPDGDTIGATVALGEYLRTEGKHVSIACPNQIPERIGSFLGEDFLSLKDVKIDDFEVLIGCDSVDRGFGDVWSHAKDGQVTVAFDHHPDTLVEADITIIDDKKSSTCELIYEFLEEADAGITPHMATALLIGLVFDTGNFQHSSTTPRVMEIASMLMKRGGSLQKAVDIVFANKKVSALKLWGRAFLKAKIYEESGMIVSALTQEDLEACSAKPEDVYQVVSVLNTVPGTRFSLVIFQRDESTIKGHLRSEEYKGVDVLQIAGRFGGGGHRLASGFEIPGRIVETDFGWKIV